MHLDLLAAIFATMGSLRMKPAWRTELTKAESLGPGNIM